MPLNQDFHNRILVTTVSRQALEILIMQECNVIVIVIDIGASEVMRFNSVPHTTNLQQTTLIILGNDMEILYNCRYYC